MIVLPFPYYAVENKIDDIKRATKHFCFVALWLKRISFFGGTNVIIDARFG